MITCEGKWKKEEKEEGTILTRKLNKLRSLWVSNLINIEVASIVYLRMAMCLMKTASQREDTDFHFRCLLAASWRVDLEEQKTRGWFPS